MTLRIIPKIRGVDRHGCGLPGASRGGRDHNGVDFEAEPTHKYMSLAKGVVTKIGFPYSHDLSFTYVQVTDEDGYHARHFYIEPSVDVGEEVKEGDTIGTVQELPYGGITQHCHFEVKKDGEYYDPIWYLVGVIKEL